MVPEVPGNPERRPRRIKVMESLRARRTRQVSEPPPDDLGVLLGRVAHGDEDAFDALYTQVAGRVYGLARRVVRDPAQAEEIAQEALVDVWRAAARYDPTRGSALSWVMTIVHRRAVDRVRSEEAASDRESRAHREETAYDEVSELVTDRMQAERVRRCLGSLTDLQRDSVQLAYYRGLTYREVAELLHVPLGTIKTRLRDGLIRLRDCLGVEW